MLVSSVCACIGQLFWKLSAEQGILFLLCGFGFYGIGALVMLIAYRFGKLSILQPMLLSYGILKERLTGKKIAGTCLILIGALFVSF